MKKVLASACALVVMAGCSQTPRVQVDPETGRADVDMEPAGQHTEEWTGAVRGMGQWTGIGGTATVHVRDDMTHAMVSLTGAPAGATLPWHVHEGTCADGMGPIVGPAGAYPPLTVGSDGRASGAAELRDVELNEAKRYHVNVHRSASEMGTIVACADIDD